MNFIKTAVVVVIANCTLSAMHDNNSNQQMHNSHYGINNSVANKNHVNCNGRQTIPNQNNINNMIIPTQLEYIKRVNSINYNNIINSDINNNMRSQNIVEVLNGVIQNQNLICFILHRTEGKINELKENMKKLTDLLSKQNNTNKINEDSEEDNIK